MRGTHHTFQIEQGTATTASSMSSPTASFTLEAQYGIAPKVVVTAIGEDTANVNMWVDTITALGRGRYQVTVESSLPNITFHWRVVASERI